MNRTSSRRKVQIPRAADRVESMTCASDSPKASPVRSQDDQDQLTALTTVLEMARSLVRDLRDNPLQTRLVDVFMRMPPRASNAASTRSTRTGAP
jgi:hypothetical protein